MRSLATIQKISSITSIVGADRIELAMMYNLGWQCVIAKKNNFKIDDKVIYFEVDSILPEKPEFEFLRERKFRIKTIKLKSVVSQGLIIPIPEGMKDLEIGTDVTECMGVKKFDSQAQEEKELSIPKHRSAAMRFMMRSALFRKIYFALNTVEKSEWPSFAAPKTDEERIQTCAKILMEHFNEDWYITEKLDGQSSTFFTYDKSKWGFKSKAFGVCSRNIWLKTKTSSNYWHVAEKYDLEKKMSNFPDNIAVQGEILSTNVQGNKYKVSEVDFYVFNIYEKGQRVSVDRMVHICNSLGLKTVPVIYTSFIPAYAWMDRGEVKDVVQAAVEMSSGKSTLFDVPREGLVFRLNKMPSISFKAINPNFLLKYE